MKLPEEINKLPLFDEIQAATSEETKMFMQRSLAIANQIACLLEEKSMRQKDLADLLGKKEAEISRWLSGFHNFTIKSIVKIEQALETQIIYTRAEFLIPEPPDKMNKRTQAPLKKQRVGQDQLV